MSGGNAAPVRAGSCHLHLSDGRVVVTGLERGTRRLPVRNCSAEIGECSWATQRFVLRLTVGPKKVQQWREKPGSGIRLSAAERDCMAAMRLQAVVRGYRTRLALWKVMRAGALISGAARFPMYRRLIEHASPLTFMTKADVIAVLPQRMQKGLEGVDDAPPLRVLLEPLLLPLIFSQFHARSARYVELLSLRAQRWVTGLPKSASAVDELDFAAVANEAGVAVVDGFFAQRRRELASTLNQIADLEIFGTELLRKFSLRIAMRVHMPAALLGEPLGADTGSQTTTKLEHSYAPDVGGGRLVLGLLVSRRDAAFVGPSTELVDGYSRVENRRASSFDFVTVLNFCSNLDAGANEFHVVSLSEGTEPVEETPLFWTALCHAPYQLAGLADRQPAVCLLLRPIAGDIRGLPPGDAELDPFPAHVLFDELERSPGADAHWFSQTRSAVFLASNCHTLFESVRAVFSGSTGGVAAVHPLVGHLRRAMESQMTPTDSEESVSPTPSPSGTLRLKQSPPMPEIDNFGDGWRVITVYGASERELHARRSGRVRLFLHVVSTPQQLLSFAKRGEIGDQLTPRSEGVMAVIDVSCVVREGCLLVYPTIEHSLSVPVVERSRAPVAKISLRSVDFSLVDQSVVESGRECAACGGTCKILEHARALGFDVNSAFQLSYLDSQKPGRERPSSSSARLVQIAQRLLPHLQVPEVGKRLDDSILLSAVGGKGEMADWLNACVAETHNPTIEYAEVADRAAAVLQRCWRGYSARRSVAELAVRVFWTTHRSSVVRRVARAHYTFLDRARKRALMFADSARSSSASEDVKDMASLSVPLPPSARERGLMEFSARRRELSVLLRRLADIDVDSLRFFSGRLSVRVSLGPGLRSSRAAAGEQREAGGRGSRDGIPSLSICVGSFVRDGVLVLDQAGDETFVRLVEFDGVPQFVGLDSGGHGAAGEAYLRACAFWASLVVPRGRRVAVNGSAASETAGESAGGCASASVQGDPSPACQAPFEFAVFVRGLWRSPTGSVSGVNQSHRQGGSGGRLTTVTLQPGRFLASLVTALWHNCFGESPSSLDKDEWVGDAAGEDARGPDPTDRSYEIIDIHAASLRSLGGRPGARAPVPAPVLVHRGGRAIFFHPLWGVLVLAATAPDALAIVRGLSTCSTLRAAVVCERGPSALARVGLAPILGREWCFPHHCGGSGRSGDVADHSEKRSVLGDSRTVASQVICGPFGSLRSLPSRVRGGEWCELLCPGVAGAFEGAASYLPAAYRSSAGRISGLVHVGIGAQGSIRPATSGRSETRALEPVHFATVQGGKLTVFEDRRTILKVPLRLCFVDVVTGSAARGKEAPGWIKVTPAEGKRVVSLQPLQAPLEAWVNALITESFSPSVVGQAGQSPQEIAAIRIQAAFRGHVTRVKAWQGVRGHIEARDSPEIVRVFESADLQHNSPDAPKADQVAREKLAARAHDMFFARALVRFNDFERRRVQAGARAASWRIIVREVEHSCRELEASRTIDRCVGLLGCNELDTGSASDGSASISAVRSSGGSLSSSQGFSSLESYIQARAPVTERGTGRKSRSASVSTGARVLLSASSFEQFPGQAADLPEGVSGAGVGAMQPDGAAATPDLPRVWVTQCFESSSSCEGAGSPNPPAAVKVVGEVVCGGERRLLPCGPMHRKLLGVLSDCGPGKWFVCEIRPRACGGVEPAELDISRLKVALRKAGDEPVIMYLGRVLFPVVAVGRLSEQLIQAVLQFASETAAVLEDARLLAGDAAAVQGRLRMPGALPAGRVHVNRWLVWSAGFGVAVTRKINGTLAHGATRRDIRAFELPVEQLFSGLSSLAAYSSSQLRPARQIADVSSGSLRLGRSSKFLASFAAHSPYFRMHSTAQLLEEIRNRSRLESALNSLERASGERFSESSSALPVRELASGAVSEEEERIMADMVDAGAGPAVGDSSGDKFRSPTVSGGWRHRAGRVRKWGFCPHVSALMPFEVPRGEASSHERSRDVQELPGSAGVQRDLLEFVEPMDLFGERARLAALAQKHVACEGECQFFQPDRGKWRGGVWLELRDGTLSVFTSRHERVLLELVSLEVREAVALGFEEFCGAMPWDCGSVAEPLHTADLHAKVLSVRPSAAALSTSSVRRRAAGAVAHSSTTLWRVGGRELFFIVGDDAEVDSWIVTFRRAVRLLAVRQHSAALCIQSVWRGFSVRMRLEEFVVRFVNRFSSESVARARLQAGIQPSPLICRLAASRAARIAAKDGRLAAQLALPLSPRQTDSSDEAEGEGPKPLSFEKAVRAFALRQQELNSLARNVMALNFSSLFVLLEPQRLSILPPLGGGGGGLSGIGGPDSFVVEHLFQSSESESIDDVLFQGGPDVSRVSYDRHTDSDGAAKKAPAVSPSSTARSEGRSFFCAVAIRVWNGFSYRDCLGNELFLKAIPFDCGLPVFPGSLDGAVESVRMAVLCCSAVLIRAPEEFRWVRRPSVVLFAHWSTFSCPPPFDAPELEATAVYTDANLDLQHSSLLKALGDSPYPDTLGFFQTEEAASAQFLLYDRSVKSLERNIGDVVSFLGGGMKSEVVGIGRELLESAASGSEMSSQISGSIEDNAEGEIQTTLMRSPPRGRKGRKVHKSKKQGESLKSVSEKSRTGEKEDHAQARAERERAIREEFGRGFRRQVSRGSAPFRPLGWKYVGENRANEANGTRVFQYVDFDSADGSGRGFEGRIQGLLYRRVGRLWKARDCAVRHGRLEESKRRGGEILAGHSLVGAFVDVNHSFVRREQESKAVPPGVIPPLPPGRSDRKKPRREASGGSEDPPEFVFELRCRTTSKHGGKKAGSVDAVSAGDSEPVGVMLDASRGSLGSDRDSRAAASAPVVHRRVPSSVVSTGAEEPKVDVGDAVSPARAGSVVHFGCRDRFEMERWINACIAEGFEPTSAVSSLQDRQAVMHRAAACIQSTWRGHAGRAVAWQRVLNVSAAGGNLEVEKLRARQAAQKDYAGKDHQPHPQKQAEEEGLDAARVRPFLRRQRDLRETLVDVRLFAAGQHLIIGSRMADDAMLLADEVGGESFVKIVGLDSSYVMVDSTESTITIPDFAGLPEDSSRADLWFAGALFCWFGLFWCPAEGSFGDGAPNVAMCRFSKQIAECQSRGFYLRKILEGHAKTFARLFVKTGFGVRSCVFCSSSELGRPGRQNDICVYLAPHVRSCANLFRLVNLAVEGSSSTAQPREDFRLRDDSGSREPATKEFSAQYPASTPLPVAAKPAGLDFCEAYDSVVDSLLDYGPETERAARVLQSTVRAHRDCVASFSRLSAMTSNRLLAGYPHGIVRRLAGFVDRAAEHRRTLLRVRQQMDDRERYFVSTHSWGMHPADREHLAAPVVISDADSSLVRRFELAVQDFVPEAAHLVSTERLVVRLSALFFARTRGVDNPFNGIEEVERIKAALRSLDKHMLAALVEAFRKRVVALVRAAARLIPAYRGLLNGLDPGASSGDVGVMVQECAANTALEAYASLRSAAVGTSDGEDVPPASFANLCAKVDVYILELEKLYGAVYFPSGVDIPSWSANALLKCLIRDLCVAVGQDFGARSVGEENASEARVPSVAITSLSFELLVCVERLFRTLEARGLVLTALPIHSVFSSLVGSWIKHTEARLGRWVNNAVQIAQWKPISDTLRFSPCLVDVFQLLGLVLRCLRDVFFVNSVNPSREGQQQQQGAAAGLTARLSVFSGAVDDTVFRQSFSDALQNLSETIVRVILLFADLVSRAARKDCDVINDEVPLLSLPTGNNLLPGRERKARSGADVSSDVPALTRYCVKLNTVRSIGIYLEDLVAEMEETYVSMPGSVGFVRSRGDSAARALTRDFEAVFLRSKELQTELVELFVNLIAPVVSSRLEFPDGPDGYSVGADGVMQVENRSAFRVLAAAIEFLDSALEVPHATLDSILFVNVLRGVLVSVCARLRVFLVGADSKGNSSRGVASTEIRWASSARLALVKAVLPLVVSYFHAEGQGLSDRAVQRAVAPLERAMEIVALPSASLQLFVGRRGKESEQELVHAVLRARRKDDEARTREIAAQSRRDRAREELRERGREVSKKEKDVERRAQELQRKEREMLRREAEQSRGVVLADRMATSGAKVEELPLEVADEGACEDKDSAPDSLLDVLEKPPDIEGASAADEPVPRKEKKGLKRKLLKRATLRKGKSKGVASLNDVRSSSEPSKCDDA